jgi:hypothetical protein
MFELVEVERVRYFVLCLVCFGGQSNDGRGAKFVEVRCGPEEATHLSISA